MMTNDCLFEQASHIGIGISLLFISMGLSLISGTILPILGLFLAIPVYFTAGFFLTAPPSEACAIH